MSYDPAVNLIHHPISLERAGKNPFGEPLYRLILGGSRCHLASDGESGFTWVPTYPEEMATSWVLERWIDAWEFSQCTSDQWNMTMARFLGPYPSRGDYQICDAQLQCSPDDANLEKLIAWVEISRERKMSASGGNENRNALKDQYVAEDKANQSTVADIALNAMSAYINNPFVSTSDSTRSAKRGSKTQPILKTAEELGLPTKSGAFVNHKRGIEADGNHR